MSALIVGDQTVWANPDELGHFGIKLRKQAREDEIVEQMLKRRALARTQAEGEK